MVRTNRYTALKLAMYRSRRPRRVLVIEDTQEIADLFRLVLEDEGFDTEVAASGPEALQQVRTFDPDLITLDLQLPGLSGVEVLRRLKADQDVAGIPVVVVSAFHEELADDDRRLAAALVPKPFDIDHVVQVVEHFV